MGMTIPDDFVADFEPQSHTISNVAQPVREVEDDLHNALGAPVEDQIGADGILRQVSFSLDDTTTRVSILYSEMKIGDDESQQAYIFRMGRAMTSVKGIIKSLEDQLSKIDNVREQIKRLRESRGNEDARAGDQKASGDF